MHADELFVLNDDGLLLMVSRLQTTLTISLGTALFLTTAPYYEVVLEAPLPVGYQVSDLLVYSLFHWLFIPLLVAAPLEIWLALRQRPRTSLLVFVPLALLGVWQLMAISWSVDASTSAYRVGVYWLLLGASVALFALARAGGEAGALAGLLAAAGIHAAVAVGQSVAGGPLGLGVFGEIYYQPELIFGVADPSYRAPGLLYHPNVLAGMLVTALYLCGYLAARVSSWGMRGTLGGVALLLLAGVAATQSRTAILALLAGGGLVLLRAVASAPVRRLFTRERLMSWQTAALAGAVGVLLAGAWFAPPAQAAVGRFVEIAAHPGDHLGRMLYFVPESLRAVDARPWRGYGSGAGMLGLIAYNPSLDMLLPAHNVYVWLAVEGGYLASGLFVLALLAAAPVYVARWELGRVILVSGLAGLALMMLFDHYFWTDARFAALLLLYLGLVYAQRAPVADDG